jgi:transposase, IS5 family
MNKHRGFFDEQDRLALINSEGDPLEKLNRAINWEIFRGKLRRCFAKDPQEPGGRPPFDYVLMFKVLVLQRLYNLSDAQMQFQLLDRLSFQRFLGLGLNSTMPDQKTIWAFREKLTERGLIEKLFVLFQEYLDGKGIIANRGSIIDATFVELPRQRNNRDENEQIRGRQSPSGWSEEKERQKDTDARWTKKREETFFGYKDHVKVDKVSKVITSYDVTDASVHDSRVLPKLANKRDEHHEVFADSAYEGKKIERVLEKRKARNRIHEKGHRNHPLTAKQKENNRKKSTIRARIEHVFAFMTTTMKGLRIRSIGIERAHANIGMINLVYNISRYALLWGGVVCPGGN